MNTQENHHGPQAGLEVEIGQRQLLYRGFMQLEQLQLRHRCYDGHWSAWMRRELLDRGQAVALVLVDPVAQMLVLVEQFRVGALADEAGAWLLELVAGMIEIGEQPAAVALRECLEEAGCQPHHLTFISRFYLTPGGSNEQIYLYYGEVDSRGLNGRLAGAAHEGEDIRVRLVPLAQLEELLASSRIRNATTLVGLQWLLLQQRV
ncbi:MAG: NUDIX domain-containing protein [Desulfuromonas thiophila]|nr:NUDIX domain-containing protein [Desulfuromonas thiophila]